jgi:hypothetical protein
VWTKCLKGKFLTYFVHFFYMLPDDSDGRIAKEHWLASEEFSPAGIISPWFSWLIYHLRDEQEARLWPQFRDVVSLPSTWSINQSNLSYNFTFYSWINLCWCPTIKLKGQIWIKCSVSDKYKLHEMFYIEHDDYCYCPKISHTSNYNATVTHWL